MIQDRRLHFLSRKSIRLRSVPYLFAWLGLYGVRFACFLHETRDVGPAPLLIFFSHMVERLRRQSIRPLAWLLEAFVPITSLDVTALRAYAT